MPHISSPASQAAVIQTDPYTAHPRIRHHPSLTASLHRRPPLGKQYPRMALHPHRPPGHPPTTTANTGAHFSFPPPTHSYVSLLYISPSSLPFYNSKTARANPRWVGPPGNPHAHPLRPLPTLHPPLPQHLRLPPQILQPRLGGQHHPNRAPLLHDLQRNDHRLTLLLRHRAPMVRRSIPLVEFNRRRLSH